MPDQHVIVNSNQSAMSVLRVERPPMPDPNFDTNMAAAALAGAGASVLMNREPESPWRKLADGTVGALVGIFCGPFIADTGGIENQHARIAVAFVCGAVGIVLLTAVMSWAKGQSAADWLRKFLGKG